MTQSRNIHTRCLCSLNSASHDRDSPGWSLPRLDKLISVLCIHFVTPQNNSTSSSPLEWLIDRQIAVNRNSARMINGSARCVLVFKSEWVTGSTSKASKQRLCKRKTSLATSTHPLMINSCCFHSLWLFFPARIAPAMSSIIWMSNAAVRDPFAWLKSRESLSLWTIFGVFARSLSCVLFLAIKWSTISWNEMSCPNRGETYRGADIEARLVCLLVTGLDHHRSPPSSCLKYDNFEPVDFSFNTLNPSWVNVSGRDEKCNWWSRARDMFFVTRTALLLSPGSVCFRAWTIIRLLFNDQRGGRERIHRSTRIYLHMNMLIFGSRGGCFGGNRLNDFFITFPWTSSTAFGIPKKTSKQGSDSKSILITLEWMIAYQNTSTFSFVMFFHIFLINLFVLYIHKVLLRLIMLVLEEPLGINKHKKKNRKSSRAMR